MTETYQKYLEYLESEHWSALRKEAFMAASRRCEACKSPKELRGHHLRYCENLETCTVEDIMCLCERCHDLWHKWLKHMRLKVGDFCRQSTRGGILVLLNPVPVDNVSKPEVPKTPQLRPVYPVYISPAKQIKPLSKSERKRIRKAEKAAKRAALRAQRSISRESKEERKARREVVKTDISSNPAIQTILTEAKTREEARRRMNRLSKGWPNRALVMHWSLKTWEDKNQPPP